MNKFFFIFSFLCIFTLFESCSFDKKTGFWKGSESERARIAQLEKKQNSKTLSKYYSSEKIYNKEIQTTEIINIENPTNNKNWSMSGLNYGNNVGNLFLSGTNTYFKKNIGKNKFKIFKSISSPLYINNNIILTDDSGTIFSTNESGRVNWKLNIYKKLYKKIFKNLALTIYKDKIYISDNIGFIYRVDLESGEIDWIKNMNIPLKSIIKVYKDKIFVVNQDNRLLCLSINDGAKFWDIRSAQSFIKSQSILSLAVSDAGDLISINTAGDLIKVESKSGRIYWSLKVIPSLLAHDNDFFTSSDIVINNQEVIISVEPFIFSFDLETGYLNWKTDVSTSSRPIILDNNIFLITDNGYFVILNRKSGKIISSTNIFKILKQKDRDTKVSGYILGSNKIYATTQNGFIIVISASSSSIENFIKVGGEIYSNPIISNGSLFVFTEEAKLIGYR